MRGIQYIRQSLNIKSQFTKRYGEKILLKTKNKLQKVSMESDFTVNEESLF